MEQFLTALTAFSYRMLVVLSNHHTDREEFQKSGRPQILLRAAGRTLAFPDRLTVPPSAPPRTYAAPRAPRAGHDRSGLAAPQWRTSYPGFPGVSRTALRAPERWREKRTAVGIAGRNRDGESSRSIRLAGRRNGHAAGDGIPTNRAQAGRTAGFRHRTHKGAKGRRCSAVPAKRWYGGVLNRRNTGQPGGRERAEERTDRAHRGRPARHAPGPPENRRPGAGISTAGEAEDA